MATVGSGDGHKDFPLPALYDCHLSHMRRQTHTNAAAYDTWVREQVQEAMDDPRPSIEHADVMKKAQARIEAMRKGKRATKA